MSRARTARLLCMLATLLSAVPVASQDDKVTAKDFEEIQNARYPDFIQRAREEREEEERRQAEAAEPDSVETEPVNGVEESPPAPQVLAVDLASTTTWTQTRTRLDDALQGLRLVVAADGSVKDFDEKADQLNDDVVLLVRMAPHQAPRQERSLEYQQARIEKQVALMKEYFSEGDLRRLQTADSLLQGSLQQVRQILVLSDIDRGIIEEPPTNLPDDWNVGGFEAREFRLRISGYSSRQLMDAYRERRRSIEDMLDGAPESWNPQLAVEMGELARQLPRRVNDVPVTSEIPFQNVALRLDVLAEALYDYMNKGNYLYARRHLRVIDDAVEEAEAFLRLKGSGF